MSLIAFKIIAALFIFIIAILAGLLSSQIHHFHKEARHYTDAITNGIFLGAALFHMLPDAQHDFAALGFVHYPYALVLCFTGFILLQFIKFLTLYIHKQAHNMKIDGTMILIVLTFHSLIEGAALGVNTIITNAFVIFIAIVAHKSCDSFALATTLRRYNIFTKHTILAISLFALATPIGIALASLTMGLLSSRSGVAVEAALNAIAAGTFIYIGGSDVLREQFRTLKLSQKVNEFLLLLLGMGIMGLIAIWF